MFCKPKYYLKTLKQYYSKHTFHHESFVSEVDFKPNHKHQTSYILVYYLTITCIQQALQSNRKDSIIIYELTISYVIFYRIYHISLDFK